VALVEPFRALRYDPGAAGPLDDLVAPPYDVVTPALQRELLERSPWNAVRLVRPESPEDAARTLAEWREREVLVREARPAVWVVEESFTGPDGVARVRRGLTARVGLEPYAKGLVLPHERTFPAAKEARLRIMRATRTKLSPIFLLHQGAPPEIPARAPDLEASFQGVTSRLWRLDDPAAIERAVAAISTPMVIADGHHRYETALRYHEEEGTEETGHVLAVLVAHADPGLVVFPTHRLVPAAPELNGGFRVTPAGRDGSEALARLEAVPRDRPAFVLLSPDGAVLAESLDEPHGPAGHLDTAAIDRLGLEDVTFTPSLADAEAAVASGRAGAALLVRAPTVAEVEAVARAGETMPQKSTYFFPKLTSGLLLSPFDE
jgi:uncharacterized protein (DUF1015 family)